MQRIHPAAHLMLCAWVFTGAVTSADESEHRVDELKLKQFQRSVNIIEIRRAELDEAMDTQFDKLVTDTLGGGIQDDEVYVEPVANLAERILEEFDGQLNDSMVTRLRNTLARQDSQFARRVNAVIVEARLCPNVLFFPGGVGKEVLQNPCKSSKILDKGGERASK